MWGYSLTVPNDRRNARKAGVSGSSSTYSFIREPSTQTLVWTDLTTRTLGHLPHGICCRPALLRCCEVGKTHPHAAFPFIDPVVDERGAVEAGTGDNVVRLCEDVTGLVVIQVPYVKGDDREIRCRGVKADIRVSFDLLNEEGGEIPALPG